MHPFERHMLTCYVAALAGEGEEVWARWWRNTEVSQWVHRHHHLLGLRRIPAPEDGVDAPGNFAARDAVFTHLARRRSKAAPQPSALERKLAWLGEEVGLGTLDRSILGLLVRVSVSVEFYALCLALTSHFIPERLLVPRQEEVNLRNIAALLALSPAVASRRLGPEAPLVMFGIVEDRRDNDFAPSASTTRIARAPHGAPDKLRQILLGIPKATALSWEDFSQLGEDGEMAAAILEAAIKRKARGINILLHGTPGTGKSAFASVLAARLGLHALFVGESVNAGEEPDRQQRVGALALAQKLSSRMERLLLVVDEAEDIFVGVDDSRGADRRGAKVFMNNLVEGNPSPTLFISNHPGRLGQAVLRRMTYALEFPNLDRSARARIVRRAATRHGLALSQGDVHALACLDAPPALIDHGLRAASLCDAGTAAALRATSSVLKVMDRRPVSRESPKAEFHAAFACADEDLDHLTEKVVVSGRTDISMCLSGPPGTGKSAYARHLAGRMGLEVVEKRASDLLGMYVGQTEQNIATCFREAETKRAFLIFEEADSLLRDRATARHSWELQQVNEMLTWMERHPFPFACTTNFGVSLDPAAARRFLFKVKFLPLGRAQARALFRHTFSIAPPLRLDTLSVLTPGDFALVARKAEVTGDRDPDFLVQALAAEMEGRPDAVNRPIGFLPISSAQ